MARSAAALALLAVLCFSAFAPASASTPEGVAWLAAKAKEEGVVVLPSGLQYKVCAATRERRNAQRASHP